MIRKWKWSSLTLFGVYHGDLDSWKLPYAMHYIPRTMYYDTCTLDPIFYTLLGRFVL